MPPKKKTLIDIAKEPAVKKTAAKKAVSKKISTKKTIAVTKKALAKKAKAVAKAVAKDNLETQASVKSAAKTIQKRKSNITINEQWAVAKPYYEPEVSPNVWMMPNRMHFQDWVRSVFAYKKHSPELYMHQKFIKDYLQYNSPYHGIFLYHGLGVGKTRSAIAASEVLRDKMGVIVMLGASLEINFRNEIQKCGNPVFRNEQHWVFHAVENGNVAVIHEKARELRVSTNIIKRNGGIWYGVPGKPSNFQTLSEEHRQQLSRQMHNMIDNGYTFIHYNGITAKKLSSMMDDMKTENIFDNKVVIIDEVHNFISRVLGGKNNSTTVRLYQMLMDAKNARLILLSGTPIINRPIELGYLANLIRGFIYVYSWPVRTMKNLNQEAILSALEQNKYVDHFSIRHDKAHIEFSLLPQGFEFADKTNYYVHRSKHDKPLVEIIDDIKQMLVQYGAKLYSDGCRIDKMSLFPKDEEEFENLFVDYEKEGAESIRNSMLMSRRLQGLVSYYESYDPKEYPDKIPIQYVKVPMSTEQFKQYEKVRHEEIAKERLARRYQSRDAKRNELKNGNIYRSFSRALCNFVFPASIERPYPSKLKEMISELDLGYDDLLTIREAEEGETEFEKADGKVGKIDGTAVDGKVEVPAKKTTSRKTTKKDAKYDMARMYDQKIEEALSAIEDNAHEFLQEQGLQKYAPKFKEVLTRVKQSQGPVLLYSVFRSVEGIRLFSMTLDAAGYRPLRLVKHHNGEKELVIQKSDAKKEHYITFTDDKEDTQLLLDIFNSDFDKLPPNILRQLKDVYGEDVMNDKNQHGRIIRVLMITQSGAEGISLKNVRQVHIMEPYWNDIRIQQVIGRAIRAKSHLALPKDERRVETFMYVTTLTDEQKQKSRTLALHDKGQTSDEYILNIAERKATINNNLLQVLKNAAADCNMNRDVHGPSVKCFTMPKDKKNRNLHIYEYTTALEDLKDEEVKQITKEVVNKIDFVVIGKAKGRTLVMHPSTHELFFKEDIDANGLKKSKAIGKIIGYEAGKAKQEIELYKKKS
jgi:hypothetical protein